MTHHVLQAIAHARTESVDEDALIGIYDRYKRNAEYSNWAKLLCITDWERLNACVEWAEMLSCLELMESKYLELWELAGKPTDYEAWNKKVTCNTVERVDHTYWKAYDAKVSGYPEKKGLLQ